MLTTTQVLAGGEKPFLPLMGISGSARSIEAYKTSVMRIPLLASEEREGLASGLRKRDKAATDRLVTSHLRLVASIARTQFSTVIPEADLIQEGTIGLLKAAEGFDPDRGVEFATYAIPYIKSEISQYVIKNEQIVRRITTKPHRKLYYNLHRYLANNPVLREEHISMICKDLDLTRAEVADGLARLRSGDVAIDMPSSLGDGVPALCDILEAENADPATVVEFQDRTAKQSTALAQALGELDERSRYIVTARWLGDPDEKKPTLDVLAEELGVSMERVRQIEKVALRKMRAVVGAFH